MFVDLTPDELLSTTRSVRKRLDLESVAREWQDRLAGLVVENWPDFKAEQR